MITQSIRLSGSVGKGGQNRSADVRSVQERLNELMGPSRQKLAVDGRIGPKTEAMIRDFQVNVLEFQWPDERVDPAGKTIRALNDPNSAEAWSRISRVPIHVVIPGEVPVIAQPSSLVCWATVATMMISWRKRRSMQISEAIGTLGEPWVSKFNNNRVLLWTDTEAFGRSAGMTLIPLQSLPVAGFAEVLQRARSPLFVSIHPNGNRQNLTHIIVVTGMMGDGTAAGTNVMYNDPNGGRRRTLSFQAFHRLYENSERAALTVQIMHY